MAEKHSFYAVDEQGNKTDETLYFNGKTIGSGGGGDGTGIFEDEDGDGTYEQTTGDGIDVPSVSTDQASLNTLNGHSANPAGFTSGGTKRFATEFVGEPFNDGDYDPMIFHRSHWDDNRYRVIIQNPGTNEHRLYTTTDFESFTLESSDILPNRQTGGGYSMQDHVVLKDGTFVLYETADSSRTEVWTGDSLTNLTQQGTAVSEPDCGVFYEVETDTVHIYTEDQDNVTGGGVGSDKLSHFTTSGGDLLTATQQSDAIDVTGESWHTGDPDLIQIDGQYWMFFDNTASHPTYNIALAKSADLYNWTIVNENITPDALGGDIVVARRGGHLEAFTEYSGSDEAGIGHWRLYPDTSTQLFRARPTSNATGVSAGTFTTISFGKVLHDYAYGVDKSAGSYSAPEQGLYRWTVAAKFSNVSDQDTLAVRVYNKTTNSSSGHMKSWDEASGSLDEVVGPYSFVVEQEPGDEWVAQATNYDSSYDLTFGNTWVQIEQIARTR